MPKTPVSMPAQGINISLAAYPARTFADALHLASTTHPSDPFLGALAIAETQLCPQNLGQLTVEGVQALREQFPDVRLRLHATVKVLPKRVFSDLSSFNPRDAYWQTLAKVSQAANAPAYTAHAGRRSESSLKRVFDATRRAEDLFGCPVGVEGHYPTPKGKPDFFLLSSWEEYAAMLEEPGLRYAIDLSHLHIVATYFGRYEKALVQELLASENCIEVHVSGNDGSADQHMAIHGTPWWAECLAHIHPKAVIFSEGRAH